MVEIDSDAGQSNGRVDMSSHDLSMARRDNSPPTPLWLFEVFLHVDDRYGRIAAGSPRSGIGILGLRLLEHYINLIPTMRHGVAVPMFDHSAGNPRYLGWRQKVATWPLSKQEAMSNRVFVVQLEAPIEGCSEPLEVPRPPDDSSPGASKKSGLDGFAAPLDCSLQN
ncbi:hypothetical protein CH063_10036 [Colletotrichum higginsianum]|uniref:Uncharacterized protein n=1 Tax=Colletotrichum higginsianum (strain IMI 349063) TaxID=759273 RepID=H1VFW3_COLHI|nr:hypothetical protein CH063_10036 [Colletotrichum higginsianum]